MSGILTASEHEASLRVLRALRTPVCATVVLTWPADEVRAYVQLVRSGYVAALARPLPEKLSAPFRWDRVASTPAGLEYLRQIELTQAGYAPV